jgi:hypothetical protein
MQALATRLIQLKGIFPGGDAGRILLQDPVFMVTRDASMLQQSAERLRQLLPDVDIDRYSSPCMLFTMHRPHLCAHSEP